MVGLSGRRGCQGGSRGCDEGGVGWGGEGKRRI